jgi:hypothetical protein
MVDIVLVGVLNTKVVKNKTEGDVTSLVLPQTCGEWYRMVPKGDKACNQLIVGQLACLGRPIRAFPDLHIHTVAVDEWSQIVLLHDGRR